MFFLKDYMTGSKKNREEINKTSNCIILLQKSRNGNAEEEENPRAEWVSHIQPQRGKKRKKEKFILL